MKATLEVINQMQADGVIGQYAIGGAVGATFYLEPVATKEYIVIANWPVQFLPSGNALVEEALAQAIETEVEGLKTRVMTAEHLLAIALQTGRAKDFSRILQFIESGAIDAGKLDLILARHELVAKWQQFEHKFTGNK